MSAVDLAAILAALPRLTGDELRRVAEAMPATATAWDDHYLGPRRYNLARAVFHAGVSRDGKAWRAETWAGGYEASTHPTARAAQAACDARLKAAGVRLCGEVVTEAPPMADAMLCPDPCTWVVVRRGGTYAVVRCVRCGALRTVTRSVAARMTGGRDDG